MLKFVGIILILFSTVVTGAEESICYGTVSNGRLQHGVKLPDTGPNFVAYSWTAGLIGRTYVHSKVKRIILDAYQYLETDMPGKVYKYAETGFKSGGRFKPHKTHRNGLSVDFMVPVVNKDGDSVHLPTHFLNKLGYSIEFNHKGEYQDYTIDFESLAAHIVALHKMAKKHAAELRRVIFDPKLQPFLMHTKYQTYLKKHLSFSKKPSWVRHDEHYHVDFKTTCKSN